MKNAENEEGKGGHSLKSLASYLDCMCYEMSLGGKEYAEIGAIMDSQPAGPMHVHFRAAKSLISQAEQCLMLAYYEHEKHKRLLAEVKGG